MVHHLFVVLTAFASLQAAVAAAKAEADEKAAAVKTAKAEAEAAAAATKAAAATAADGALASKLAGAPLTPALLSDILDYVQRETRATGVYIAVKDGGSGGDDESASLSYTAACKDHAFLVGTKLAQPKGVTFRVWVRPPPPDEEEELDEDGNPKPKPPPAPLPPLLIPNVLKDPNAEFFRVPRLGALLAAPFEYSSLSLPAEGEH